MSSRRAVLTGFVAAVIGAVVVVPASASQALADIIQEDDVIVEGALCSSAFLECAAGEDFSDGGGNNSAVKIKDATPVVWFEDTNEADFSMALSQNNFLITNPDTAAIMFGISASAPEDMLFVGPGAVGINTDEPDTANADLHIAAEDADSFPELLFSESFPFQQWKLVSREGFFELHDVETSEPLRVQQGAPSNALFIGSTGDIGLGTGTPARTLDVRRAGALTARFKNAASSGDRTVLVDLETGDAVPTRWRAAVGGTGNFFGLDSGQFYLQDPTDVRLMVDTDGQVGVNTTAPEGDLHVKAGEDGFTQLVLEETATPQKWQLQSVSGGLSVVDVTAGEVPLLIEPGSTSDSLYVDADNSRLGFGTSAPGAAAHFRRTDGTAKVLVEEGSTTTFGRTLLQLSNNGASRFRIANVQNGATWDFQTSGGGGSFVIDRVGGPASLDFEIQPDGDAVHLGTVTAASFITSSDRNKKTDISPAKASKLMALLRELDISTWRFKNEPEGTINLGPMAQDFHRLFGMGTDSTIDVRDLAALALVAAQTLDAQNAAQLEISKDLQAQIDELRQGDAG